MRRPTAERATRRPVAALQPLPARRSGLHVASHSRSRRSCPVSRGSRRSVLGGLLALALACGTTAPSSAIGESLRAPDPRAVELALRRPSGEWLHVGDLRGRPVLLFVFATYDGVSQAALQPLARFVRHHRDVHVIGIAAQPDAAQLLDPYERALTPPFVLTYDPEDTVATGTSALGGLDAVPTFVMLDAFGHEVERHVGFPGTRTLDRLRDRALARGGVQEGSPLPLLGEDP
jgi:hypothetical protein